MPTLEETEKRFRQIGLEVRLKEKSLLIKEERIFSILRERLDPFHSLRSELAEGLPIDGAFVSGKAVDLLPNSKLLGKVEKILEILSSNLSKIADQLANELEAADAAIEEVKENWEILRNEVEANYEKLLRELQSSKIDGTEFINLRKQIEDLSPVKDRLGSVRRDLAAHEAHRRNLLSEWEDIKSGEFRDIVQAASKVTSKLRKRVRVDVKMSGNRGPLEKLLRDEVGGNLAAAVERLRSVEQLSLPELAQSCRDGKESLVENYGLPAGAAERISGADSDLFMKIEELELPATTRIELNSAAQGEREAWQPLNALSSGQKATAILLLLLLESDAPLVVDQPEDDLDNRFITEVVIPTMRKEKRRRQFIFSTHNANIPVLGDAEQILGLAAIGEAEEGRAKIAPEHMGSIDSQPVRELVEEILEGGKDAFETRRAKYGF